MVREKNAVNKCISKCTVISHNQQQILPGLELCGRSGYFLFMVLSGSSRLSNRVWIYDPEGEGFFCLPWMLINPNEVVSLTQMQYNTVCGPEWFEITAQKPLMCKVGTLNQEVAEVASADPFH